MDTPARSFATTDQMNAPCSARSSGAKNRCDEDVLLAVRKTKIRRHDTNDQVRRAVERDRATDGRGVTAQPAQPETLADDNGLARAIVRRKRAAEDRRQADRSEQIRRRTDGREPFGLPVAR
jgi:hypothetical protein